MSITTKPWDRWKLEVRCGAACLYDVKMISKEITLILQKWQEMKDNPDIFYFTVFPSKM